MLFYTYKKSEKKARNEARAEIAGRLDRLEPYFEKNLYLFRETDRFFEYCYTGETGDHFVTINK